MHLIICMIIFKGLLRNFNVPLLLAHSVQCCICLFICSSRLAIHPSIFMSTIHPLVCPSIHPYPSLSLSVHLSVSDKLYLCLSIYGIYFSIYIANYLSFVDILCTSLFFDESCTLNKAFYGWFFLQEKFGFLRLEVRDNGSGIRSDDVSLIAKPHTTSKLASFSDLCK